MSITYYCIAKNIFAASTGVIRALAALIASLRRTWTRLITPMHQAMRSHFNISNITVCATASGKLKGVELKAGGPTLTNETAA
ncbi:MAG TPA: hypothetical protein VFS90_04055 [Pyrinomonadaceae bacterium]|nr:hypothetical protein [Pyrinomonadaceae bacterium]